MSNRHIEPGAAKRKHAPEPSGASDMAHQLQYVTAPQHIGKNNLAADPNPMQPPPSKRGGNKGFFESDKALTSNYAADLPPVPDIVNRHIEPGAAKRKHAPEPPGASDMAHQLQYVTAPQHIGKNDLAADPNPMQPPPSKRGGNKGFFESDKALTSNYAADLPPVPDIVNRRKEEFCVMEELVNIINQLQDVFSTGVCSRINLPQIVVIGTQSAGKSSVLEHIVGKSFLPRGTGIVTRCPLVLQLQNAPEATEVYATFTHKGSERFTDFNLIRKEIVDQTEKLAGNNKGISHASINLKIFSPSLLNLTLVDLPGLTKVPVGAQPTDIEEQTRNLILEYIKNPLSLILAVTPANVDMTTSDSLKIAKEVDPSGIRTLAVLTKLDLMDDGTDARDMLNGKVVPVKLGIIGVINRSQKDINDDKSIGDSLKFEAKYLKERYESIASKHGSPYLAKVVQGMLVRHIQTCLPSLNKSVCQKLIDVKSNISQYADDKFDKRNRLVDLICAFAKNYTTIIKGHNINFKSDGSYGGAKIHALFQDPFARAIRIIDPLAGLNEQEILNVIKNAYGINPALFVPERAFELLSQKQVNQFRKPSLDCVELVHRELSQIAMGCIDALQLDHYPTLKSVFRSEVNQLLQSRLSITIENVSSFIDIQVAYINTSHPDFQLKQNQSVVLLNGAGGKQYMSVEIPFDPQRKDGGNTKYVLVKDLIKNYITIVSKIVEDTVPKMIVNYLVDFVLNKIQGVLLNSLLCGKEDVESLFCESLTTISRRNELRAEILSLEKAEKILKNLSIAMMKSAMLL